MSLHFKSRHVTSNCIWSGQDTSHQVTSHHIMYMSCHMSCHMSYMSCHMSHIRHQDTSCHVTSHQDTSCHIKSHHFKSNHVMSQSHQDTSCHIKSHHVKSSHVMSHHIKAHHVTIQHITSQHMYHIMSCKKLTLCHSLSLLCLPSVLCHIFHHTFKYQLLSIF